MIVLSTETNTHFAQVIPRYYADNLTILIEDEFLDLEFTFSLLSPTYQDGFLDFNFNFSAVNQRRYKLTITDDEDNIIWKGKAKGQ